MPLSVVQCEDRFPEGAIVYRLTQIDISVSACIVVVVDESSSMDAEHAWLPGLSDGLEQNLQRQGEFKEMIPFVLCTCTCPLLPSSIVYVNLFHHIISKTMKFHLMITQRVNPVVCLALRSAPRPLEAFLVHEILPSFHIFACQGIGSTGNRRNTYSLIGYGRRSPNFYAQFLEDDSGRRVFESTSFPQAAKRLFADPEGRIEDGYEAIYHALNNIQCESNGTSSVAKNLIFISDEDRDVTPRGTNLTRSFMKRFLRQGGWLPNVVVDNSFSCNDADSIGVDSTLTAFLARTNGAYEACPEASIGRGFATTRRDYTNLALELGGAAWNINVLRRGGALAASFTNAFTDVKTKEIRRATDQCRRCTCEDQAGSGQFRCLPDNNQERCKCIAGNGQVWGSELYVWGE